MFRSAILRSARSASSQVVRSSGAIARPATQSSLITKSRFAPSAFQAARCYSAAAGLQKSEVEGRIVDLLKNFDKVSPGLRSDRAFIDGYPRFPIHRRYDRTGMSAYPFAPSINGEQLSPTSHFANDLGLDSLDTVEVVMAIEEVSQRVCMIWLGSDSMTGIQHWDPG